MPKLKLIISILAVVGIFVLIAFQVMDNGIAILLFGLACIFLGYCIKEGRIKQDCQLPQTQSETPAEIAEANKKFQQESQPQ